MNKKDPNWRKCLLKADSRDIIKRIPDNSIDFIFTDPPYNLSKHSTGNIPLHGRTAMNNDVAEWDMIDFNPEDWADEFIRILKPTGNLFIFTSYNQLGRWYNCLDHRFDTSNFMIWHKTNPAPKIFKAGFLNSCEMIFTCWNKKHTWNFISQSEMHNFLESPICMRPERLSNPKHPTQKPLSILRKVIRIASNENDIIFDPFMGVGSIGVAALELGRRFIGIELEEDYFIAAKKRVESTLKQQGNMKQTEYETDLPQNTDTSIIREPSVYTSYEYNELKSFFRTNANNSCKPTYTNLKPIIKWPGGKEKELKYIIPNAPSFNRFFEPFVGGGSVYMGLTANQYFINDFSHELITLYKCIAHSDKDFYHYVEQVDQSWINASTFLIRHNELIDFYLQYKNNILTKETLKKTIYNFCNNNRSEILNLLSKTFQEVPCTLIKELITNLHRKMVRMLQLEKKKSPLPHKDIVDNIETAIKSAIYMNYRSLYNNNDITQNNAILHCALFFFIRNYAYSGMFRYSSKGDFNVPYGGIAYNSKLLGKKLSYYRSKELLEHFDKAHIYNLDFEAFLKQTCPKEDDFIFLDPPYDTEFSTYAKNAFNREDQKRLAKYLLKECRSKWMLIIKNTEFIYELYNHEGINIRTFDKKYLVSFMNRNEKEVTHLLITNY